MLRFFIFDSIQGILSRNEKDLGAKFPEVKEGVAQDAVIDGEIVALDDKGRGRAELARSGSWKLFICPNRDSI